MLKCLNFHKTSIFSMHRGMKYMKSVLFWKFVMSVCHTSFSLGFSVFGVNVFFSSKYLTVLLTLSLKCFASSSSLILACPFKSELRRLGIFWSQAEGGRHPAVLYTGPQVLQAHLCVCKMQMIGVE